MTVAIIPARGGSKGVPGKNLALLAGQPLILRTVRTALAAKHVTRVFVSTDDPRIAELTRQAGATVIDRPPELAADDSSSESALIHALHQIKITYGFETEYTVFLQCTSPFTQAADIDKAIEAITYTHADVVFSARPFHGFVWQNDSQGRAIGVNHDPSVRLRRQDRPEELIETGAIYVLRTAGFLMAGHRFFGTIRAYMCSDPLLEIDNPQDLDIARAIHSAIRQRPTASDLRSLIEARTLNALVMDFDGVMTDNRVWIDEEGRELVACNRSDGFGIDKLRTLGVRMVVISKERNAVVQARCGKLQIDCIHGADDKLPILCEWAEMNGVPLEEIIYVGNDENDVPCLQAVGLAIAVADAHVTAKRASHVTLDKPGGHAAVRTICDALADARLSPPPT